MGLSKYRVVSLMFRLLNVGSTVIWQSPPHREANIIQYSITPLHIVECQWSIVSIATHVILYN